MSTPRIEQLNLGAHRRDRSGSRWWREWCFVLLAIKRFWLRFIIIAVVMTGGAVSFMTYQPATHPNFVSGLFTTWQLVLGETPGDFPKSIWLECLFFIMPIVGLLVIIESLIEFSLMMRDRQRYERSWCNMLAKSYSDHIVIVGFGRLGYRTFLLLRKLGEPVVVIERDDHNQFLDEVRRDGSPLLIGDARREALLNDSNITKAKAIVLATDDDLANLEVALDSRKLNPSIRVVVRMFDQNIADKMGEGFDIHTAMSQSAISAPTFAVSAIEPSIVNCMIVDTDLIVMQRWLVRPSGPLAGKTVGELMAAHNISVVEQHPVRGERRLFPAVDTTLERGDRVILQGKYEVLTEMQREAMAAEA